MKTKPADGLKGAGRRDAFAVESASPPLTEEKLIEEAIRSAKTFVFDFDGTLAELNLDFTDMKDRLLALAEHYGTDGRDLKGLLILELIDTVRDSIGSRDARAAGDFFTRAHRLIADMEMEAARKSILLDGTLSLLSTLRQSGRSIGIISRNCRAALTRVFPQIGNYADVVISRDETPHVKPHPAHLQEVLLLLDTPSGAAVMVGDHPLDIRLGRAAGTYTIGVLTGYSRRDALTASGADLVLNRAGDILAILR